MSFVNDCNNCPPIRPSESAGVARSVPAINTCAQPDGTDIPNNTNGWTFPIDKVRTFTVTHEGTGTVTVNLPTGSVTLDSPGSRTWGDGDEASKVDVSQITIDTQDTNTDVSWEV